MSKTVHSHRVLVMPVLLAMLLSLSPLSGLQAGIPFAAQAAPAARERALDLCKAAESDWVPSHLTSSPSARSAHAMAYDAARGVTVFLGGWDGDDNLGDTWEWDGEDWEQRAPASMPFYVDADATGNNDGTSWEDAYTALQPALDEAGTGDQIWVAEGTYTPTYEFSPGDPRSATFQLKNGVALYGGFDPTVGDIGWEDRDWMNNVTILSGDLNGDDVPPFGNNADNSYHVFYHPSELALDGTAILDGFTVSGGNANGSFPHYHGGGMYNQGSSPTVSNCNFSTSSAMAIGGGMFNVESSSPAVTNCTFSGNSADGAAGMYNYGSSPTVTNCTFSGNLASGAGGGMANGSSSPVVADCTFSGNSASSGGGMANGNSSPVVTNCTFSGNSAGSGGGMENSHSSPVVTTCTFTGNSAEWGAGMSNLWEDSTPVVTNCTFSGNLAVYHGGGIYNWESPSPVVSNCILWGDGPQEIWNQNSQPPVTYSDIQGGYVGTGNIDADPLFMDPANGDYHLRRGSPCIDAGTNDAPNLPEHDFEGDPRIMDGNRDETAVVDMGVDEVYGYAFYLPLVFKTY